MPTLSPELLRGLPEPTRRYTLWDDYLEGFGVRVSPRRPSDPPDSLPRMIFVVRYRVRGTHGGTADAPSRGYLRRQVTLGPYGVLTLGKAREKAREYLAQGSLREDAIAIARVQDRERLLQKTVGEVADAFLTQYSKAPDPN